MNKDFQELEKKMQEAVQTPPPVLPSRPTKRAQLVQKKAMFQEAIIRVDKALAALDRNPEFEKLLNVLQDAE